MNSKIEHGTVLYAARQLIKAWDDIAKTGSEEASARHDVYIEMLRDELDKIDNGGTPLFEKRNDNSIQTKMNYENMPGEIER